MGALSTTGASFIRVNLATLNKRAGHRYLAEEGSP